jgi:hypothetical protein
MHDITEEIRTEKKSGKKIQIEGAKTGGYSYHGI